MLNFLIQVIRNLREIDSLLIYNNSIFVIGGKNQEKCELYNFELNKWKEVRNLPEERYKCSLIIDRNEEFLY